MVLGWPACREWERPVVPNARAELSYRVRISVDADDRDELPFGWNFDPGSPLRGYVAKIDAGTCAVTDVREIGSLLWNTLCPASLKLRDRPSFDHPEALRCRLGAELHDALQPRERLAPGMR
jgi:hypothetical protein